MINYQLKQVSIAKCIVFVNLAMQIIPIDSNIFKWLQKSTENSVQNDQILNISFNK